MMSSVAYPFRRQIKAIGLVILLSISLSCNLSGQEALPPDTLTFDNEFKLLPLPVLAANPANGVMLGIAPSANWILGPKATTTRSTLVSSLIFTTYEQIISVAKSSIFTKDDRWNLIGDWRFFDTSQPTFGLGTGNASSKLATNDFFYDDLQLIKGIAEEQMMEFNYFRFHETAMRRFGNSRFFAGIGFALDIHSNINDQLLDLDSLPATITSHYGYSVKHGYDPSGYTLSGLTFNLLLDRRDNPVNPYRGNYAHASFRYNPEFLGSDQQSSSLWLEYRDYFSLSSSRPRNILAFWSFAHVQTSGNLPYLDLPAIGWDLFGRSGRGYPQGRLRGERLIYSELEYRMPLQKNKDTFGAVVFVNATTASNLGTNVDVFQYIKPAAGLGLRFMYDKRSQTNVTIDYAWSADGFGAFYLNVYEAF